MTKITVKKSTLDGNIFCPPSKSYTHRAIVISCLSNGVSNLNNVLLSRDTIATINCCKMLGMNIEETRPSSNLHLSEPLKKKTNGDRDLQLYSVVDLKISSKGARKGFKTPDDILNAENSGTTIRLLSSVCSFVNDGFTVLTGDKSLRTRPMGDLINALNQLGVICFSTKNTKTPPLIVKGEGGIKGGEVIINGQISSQFVSSLLLSSIYAKEKVVVKVLGKQVSKPYIISTMSIMKRFGIEINFTSFDNSTRSIQNHDHSNYSDVSNQYAIINRKNMDNAAVDKSNLVSSFTDDKNNAITELYNIPNDKDYTPITFKVPGDFSTAALLLSSAVLSDGHLTIHNLDFSLPQGDYNIVNILKKMGADLNVNENSGTISINGSRLMEGGVGEFNLRDTPDLLPVLSILALKCKNVVKITGISHARYKETDRVSNISSQLVKFGADVKEEFDSIFISPPTKLKNASIDSFNDHRLFMAFFIASLATDESTIEGVESVDVSYPAFVDDMRKLGAKIYF